MFLCNWKYFSSEMSSKCIDESFEEGLGAHQHYCITLGVGPLWWSWCAPCRIVCIYSQHREPRRGDQAESALCELPHCASKCDTTINPTTNTNKSKTARLLINHFCMLLVVCLTNCSRFTFVIIRIIAYNFNFLANYCSVDSWCSIMVYCFTIVLLFLFRRANFSFQDW